MYRFMAVDYHLLKRRNTKGKPVFYLAILSDVIGKNGKRKYVSMRSTGAGNIGLARKRAEELLRDGRLLASKDTLKDFLLTFWDADASEYLRGKLAEGTRLSSVYIHDNQKRIEEHFLPWFEERGITKLSQLDRRILTAWRNDLFEQAKVSPSTQNKIRQAVFVALQWAADMEMIPDNPGKAVKRVKEQHKERPIFEMRELAALFAEPWLDPRAYGACLLAFTTGARMGEVRGLLIKNVHLSESYTDIVTNYVAGDGMKPPKWGGQRLGVPLPDITIRAIQSVMDIHPWGAEPEQFLFFSTESRQRPCDTKLIDKGFFSKLGSLNIPRAGRSFHCLRHTYMTYMAGRLPEGKLSRLGIHTNTSMDNLYTHVTDEDRTVIREAVAGLLPSK